jgi:hypothetical protein
MKLPRLVQILLANLLCNIYCTWADEWWIPTYVEEDGDYLCVCSGNLVTAARMNGKGRGCMIDSTLERHRYMCAYFREFQVSCYFPFNSKLTLPD